MKWLMLLVLLVPSIVRSEVLIIYSNSTMLYGSCPTLPNVSGYGSGFVLLGVPNCVQSNAPNSDSNGIPMASDGTLDNLTVTGGQPVTFTVYVNGSPTSLSCTSSPYFSGSFPSCSDNTDTVSVYAGDLVELYESTAGSGTNPVGFSFEKN